MRDDTVLLLLIFLFMPWSCANNGAKAFDPEKNVCVPEVKVWYTNVGTLIIGQDGKPVPCTPPPKPQQK